MTSSVVEKQAPDQPRHDSTLPALLEAPRRRVRPRRVPWHVWLSVGLLVAIVLSAILADYLAPYDPLSQTLEDRLQGPTLGLNDAHLFGTDQLGRDILSRSLLGARASLVVGALAVIIGFISGTLLGLIAGYVRGWLGETIMAIADIQLAFPVMLLAIAVIAVLGPSLLNLIIIVGLSGWVPYARITRAQVLGLRESEYVLAAETLGAGHLRIASRHILPNATSPLIVLATLDLGRAIILESSLSFLGLGVQPPDPSWGQMVGQGRQFLGTAWWVSTFPGLLLLLTAVSISQIGDWLRDILDPRLRSQ